MEKLEVLELEVVTHSGPFHADEVAAVALLSVFKNVKCKVTRTREVDILEKSIENPSIFVIDVGARYDGVSNFDHHHNKDLLSSAGLVWKYLDISGYPEIDELISIIDDNDRGVSKGAKFAFSWVISQLNGKHEESDANFAKAVELAMDVFSSMKLAQDKIIEAKQIVENASIINNSTIMLNEYNNQWGMIVNGANPEYSSIKRVIWYNKYTDQWNIQVPAVEIGSFELNGSKLLPNENMVFVHANGFFAVAKSYEDCLNYLVSNGEDC